MQKLQPPCKNVHPLSHQPPSKSWGPLKHLPPPPFFENFVGGSTTTPPFSSPPEERAGCTLCLQYFLTTWITRSTRLSICLVTSSTRLSTRHICMCARSTRSTTCGLFIIDRLNKVIHQIDRKWTITSSTNFTGRCGFVFVLTQGNTCS